MVAAASRTYTGALELKSENTWCSGAFGHGPGGPKRWWVDEVGWARPRLGRWKLIFVEGGCMRVQGDDVTSQSFIYIVSFSWSVKRDSSILGRFGCSHLSKERKGILFSDEP